MGKKKDMTQINKVVEKFKEQTGLDFFERFIKEFPSSRSFKRAESDEGLSGRGWYPEGEVWFLEHTFGVNFEKEITSGVWCDFYNELYDNNW